LEYKKTYESAIFLYYPQARQGTGIRRHFAWVGNWKQASQSSPPIRRFFIGFTVFHSLASSLETGEGRIPKTFTKRRKAMGQKKEVMFLGSIGCVGKHNRPQYSISDPGQALRFCGNRSSLKDYNAIAVAFPNELERSLKMVEKLRNSGFEGPIIVCSLPSEYQDAMVQKGCMPCEKIEELQGTINRLYRGSLSGDQERALYEKGKGAVSIMSQTQFDDDSQDSQQGAQVEQSNQSMVLPRIEYRPLPHEKDPDQIVWENKRYLQEMMEQENARCGAD
jgi:hypothetical protein